MANIWNATLEPNNNVKQNTFDWTHVNNLTTQIGRITPIQCELVPAKTSFRAKPIPALQLMPMVFPVQTRMRASIAYFRYPLRALWKDYKDFIGNFREGLEEPYHDFNSQTLLDKMLGTGKLMDYLGVPTTRIGTYGSAVVPTAKIAPFHTSSIKSWDSYKEGDTLSILTSWTEVLNNCNVIRLNQTYKASTTYAFNVKLYSDDTSGTTDQFNVIAKTPFKVALCNASNVIVKMLTFRNPICTYRMSSGGVVFNWTFNIDTPAEGSFTYVALIFEPQGETNMLNGIWNSVFLNYDEKSTTDTKISVFDAVPVSDIDLDTSPYYSSNSVNKEKQIKLAAYFARAYEGIYNSVYRDNRNNPYYIDGVVQYNQWIPTYEGGADTTPYELRYANWEKDFLTTAVQSPQQGNAPLVGITTYEQVSTVNDEQGNPTTAVQTKVAMVDEDGKRYSLEFDSDNEELKNVKYVELDNGTTVRSARSLFDLVTSGISITDLRNVNAYQKFLELNMRKGYSYKEIIEGRFDVKVRYADLLLPEFFGGFSRDINMNAISQTVDQTTDGEGTYKDVLGSQAGVGYFRGGSDANIECFCDEESVIMGLLVITPLPVYTQLLPKHFLYRGLLDHFNPEFNNISFQPITYKEVCPIQAYNNNPSSLTETFGYQRPWYEYCQRYDQAHGLFRTDLSNFLMHRVFNQKPELAQSFLTIDPEQVTDVFSVTDVTDKVYGQILIECTVKLPVARVAIPRLD